MVIAVVWHLRENTKAAQPKRTMGLQFGAAGIVCALGVLALSVHSPVGVQALTNGAPFSVTRAEYVVSGTAHRFDQSVFGLQAWDRAKFQHDRTFVEVLGPKDNRAKTFGKPIVVAELGVRGNAAYVTAWDVAVRQSAAELRCMCVQVGPSVMQAKKRC